MVEGRRMHMLSIIIAWHLPWPRRKGLHVGSRGQRRLMYTIKQHFAMLELSAPDPPQLQCCPTPGMANGLSNPRDSQWRAQLTTLCPWGEGGVWKQGVA